MPSTSKKQGKFMAACAHGAKYKSCPPKKVAKEFNKADKETGILKNSFEMGFPFLREILECDKTPKKRKKRPTERQKAINQARDRHDSDFL